MKAFLLAATVLVSLNGFAQTSTELTREEKLIAFKQIGNFIPVGEYKGNKLGVSKNPFTVHRCVGGVYSANPEQLSSSLRENKAFPLEAFADSYHPNPIGITFMTIDDKITQATLTDKYVSITAEDRKDGSTEKLEIQKLEDNKVIIKVTYSNQYHPHLENGCKLDLDKEYKD